MSYVGSVVDDLISSSSSVSVNSDDEFTKLKTERERQRRDRIEQRLARSTSGHTNLIGGHSRGSLDNEHLLLSELANTSRLSMAQDDRDDKTIESDRL